MPGELITADAQVQYGDTLVMGAGTPYHIGEVEGWEDLPGFDSADVARPGSDGSWAGARFAGTRVVTVAVTVDPVADVGGRSGRELLRDLQVATRLHLDEQPLVVRAQGESLMCWARINSRVTQALSQRWILQGVLGVPLQFLATDPRRYGLDEHAAVAGPPTRSEGLQYAAVSGIDRVDYTAVSGVDRFDWGVDGNFGDITVTNAGTESTPPVVVFNGPSTTPSLLLQSPGEDDLVLEYDISLAAGETLTLDARAGTVRLNAATSNADRAYTVTARSGLLEELMLPPGESQMSFRQQSVDTASFMTVRWRDAYM